MSVIDRFVLRRLVFLFLSTLLIATAVVWVTQALRRLDVVTAKGQTLLFFIELTGLALPSLAGLIAPFALLIAVVVVLVNMTNDSELVVISSGGCNRWQIFKPFVFFAIGVSLITALLAIEIGPAGRQILRDHTTKLRVDLIVSLVSPGRFIEVDEGLTFQVSDRTASGSLRGIFLNDTRSEKTHATYLAESGELIDAGGRALLVMRNGSLQRRSIDSERLSVIKYDTYAFDLETLQSGSMNVVYRATELPVFELISSLRDDKLTDKEHNIRQAEVYDRLSQGLFPLSFCFIALLLLGEPRTFRQSTRLSVFFVILVAVGVRVATFGAVSATANTPEVFPAIFLPGLISLSTCLALILTKKRLEAPGFVGVASRFLNAQFASLQSKLFRSRATGA